MATVHSNDDLAGLLRAASVVVICLPSTPATDNLLGPSELSLLPRGAILVNVGRGAVVDEASGSGDVCARLVRAGAALDGVTWDKTPLMIASANGHVWAVQALLELGADARRTNGEQMAALDYARYPDVAELILEGKANLRGCGTLQLPSSDAMAQAPSDVLGRLNAIESVDLREDTIGFKVTGTRCGWACQ